MSSKHRSGVTARGNDAQAADSTAVLAAAADAAASPERCKEVCAAAGIARLHIALGCGVFLCHEFGRTKSKLAFTRWGPPSLSVQAARGIDVDQTICGAPALCAGISPAQKSTRA